MNDSDDIRRAVAVLRAGGLVAFPTETVYGLGADADNPAALRRIFAAKGRPEGHPLIVHLGDAAAIVDWAADVPETAMRLAARFWPGPLTIVLRRSGRVRPEVTGGQDTVGLRVPAHPVALELLRGFGGGVAAPSANRFGRVSPTTAAHVREDLGDAVDMIVDGGPCAVGIESTIVDLSGPEPAILRPGGVPREDIEAELGGPVPLRVEGPVRAPGTLPSHYAPKARVVLAGVAEQAESLRALAAAGRKASVLVLPSSSREAARGLYAALRDLDAQGCDAVVASVPAEEGLGLAVADRLRRAAGPRGDAAGMGEGGT
ncbi:MAG: L-threonylcarbamoyladenylate synthase [Myxococcota bacterium]|nr:L-threonylcarbamoyladenylate synthase [Myxococcota bacterium]